MGSCCSYRSKINRKVKTDEIINLSTNEKQNQTHVIIVTPQSKRTVPQLKRLQSNPLYRRRRRKSLNDAKLTADLRKIYDTPRKRLSMNTGADLIQNRLFQKAVGELQVSLPKIQKK